jgi:hypothetical protein
MIDRGCRFASVPDADRSVLHPAGSGFDRHVQPVHRSVWQADPALVIGVPILDFFVIRECCSLARFLFVGSFGCGWFIHLIHFKLFIRTSVDSSGCCLFVHLLFFFKPPLIYLIKLYKES